MHIECRGYERNVLSVSRGLDWGHRGLVTTALEHDPASLLHLFGGLGAHE